MGAHADEIIEEFRRDAQRSAQREDLFDIGAFYCTLHLFDALILLHFSQRDGQGVIFGFNLEATANLTAFVEPWLPQIREKALSDIAGPPTWSE